MQNLLKIFIFVPILWACSHSNTQRSIASAPINSNGFIQSTRHTPKVEPSIANLETLNEIVKNTPITCLPSHGNTHNKGSAVIELQPDGKLGLFIPLGSDFGKSKNYQKGCGGKQSLAGKTKEQIHRACFTPYPCKWDTGEPENSQTAIISCEYKTVGDSKRVISLPGLWFVEHRLAFVGNETIQWPHLVQAAVANSTARGRNYERRMGAAENSQYRCEARIPSPFTKRNPDPPGYDSESNRSGA